MAQADNSLLTPHSRNLATVLRHALRLAELAGEEQDAVRREILIHEAMACWRAAQRDCGTGPA
jgi:hypothetical protein